jgi:metal-responsive CopG/Arc/MetJ family transcriptional regulator
MAVSSWACGLTAKVSLDRILQMEYIGSMKVKTSITLSEDLLATIDRQMGTHKNRSEFIEAVLWAFVSQVRRAEQNARDIQIINQHAEQLNSEAADVLEY